MASIREKLVSEICSYCQYLKENPGEYDPDILTIAVDTFFDAVDQKAPPVPSRYLEDVYAAALSSPSSVPTIKPDVDAIKEAQNAELAERLKVDGNRFFGEGNYNAAIAKYTDAIALHNNAVYFSNRCACYQRLGEFGRAEADARRAIELDPLFARAHSRLAHSLSEQGRLEQAIAASRRAAELDSKSYSAELAQFEQRLTEKSQPGLGGLDMSSINELLRNFGGAGGSGAPPSSSPGGGAPPVDPSAAISSLLTQFPQLASVMQDPEVKRAITNPKFGEMTRAMQTEGPMAAMRYMSDPELAPIMNKVMAAFMGGMGGAQGGPRSHI